VDPKDDGPVQVIEYPQFNFRTNYGANPTFCVGTFEQAMDAAFRPDSTEDVRITVNC
jgi:hypothetical protein